MNPPPNLRRAAADALLALGDTPDAVAGTLRARGCTGRQGGLDSCPVARYLSCTLHELGAEVDGVIAFFPGAVAAVQLPDPVYGFVEAFDLGQYPDLIYTSEE